MNLRQGVLPFKIELTDRSDEVTAHAGLPLVVEAVLALVPRRAYKHLARSLRYRRWKAVRRHVLSLVTLIASGGDHVDDLRVLRGDGGLRRLLGFTLSSPTQAKDFLYRFHQAEDGYPLTPEQDAALSVAGEAQIRPEGPGLRVLADMVQRVVDQLQAVRQRRRATLDIDATIVEAIKKTALKAYEGTVGYQPQMAWWAEQGIWVHDEFRDGNVPAEFCIKEFIERAFAKLPGSVTQRRLRGDSALYNEAALTWVDDNNIEFAVSADMSESLRSKILEIPADKWQPYRTIKGDVDDERRALREDRQWAEVIDFIPDWKRNRRKNGEALRYIAIRVRSRQRDLLVDDDGRWRHFAVVTNMKWNGERLLRWQREKQGTVEHGHGVVKNELAGQPMPCGRFGANAAWWRLNALVHNLLEFLKARALPPEMSTWRPKALRFRLLNLAGRLIDHANGIILRLSERQPFVSAYIEARRWLVLLAQVPP